MTLIIGKVRYFDLASSVLAGLIFTTCLLFSSVEPSFAERADQKQSSEASDTKTLENGAHNQADEAEKLYRKAFAHYQRGRHLNAFNHAVQAADLGSAGAEVLLAKIYTDGWAVGQDRLKARGLLESAMRKGSTEAAYLLGLERSRRQGAPESRKEALEFFSRASHAGHARARLRLAQLYLDQDSRYFNPKKAARLLVTLFEYPEALYELSLLYLDGIGVPLDKKRGLRLLKLAANQGVETAQIQLASFYLAGRQVERDEAKAIGWLRLAALKGNPLAQNQLAKAYATASDDNYNAREAMKWHLISRSVGMSDVYLDSFMASLPEDLRKDVAREVSAMGILVPDVL